MASFDFVISIYCAYANSIIKFNMSDSNSSSKNDETLKILLTIDGSEQSMQAAAEYAIDMAINKERNIQIIAITVIELAKLNLSTFIAAPTYGLEDLEEKKEQAKKWLSKTERLIQDKGKMLI